jgi:2-polyprenyl-3-methyl-5-hydroxy-6-metoxy-1,4-benzoquinol methylase
MNPQDERIWDGTYKIPWDDPAFSRRMLREHLNQDHDMASRRVAWIDKQVAWLHRTILSGQPSRILDLGCGPGFYAHRLATLGHRCLGIDFGPAAIEYANQNNPDTARCEFVSGDVRQVDFRGPHDLAMILFGELNVFSPQEALAILRKVHASLSCGGQLIVELQTPDAVEQSGHAETSASSCETGLFSDKPHRCRTENQWLDEQQVAVQVFYVTKMDTENTRTFRSTTKAWSDDDLQALLSEAGFSGTTRSPEWPCNTSKLALWSARRGTS